MVFNKRKLAEEPPNQPKSKVIIKAIIEENHQCDKKEPVSCDETKVKKNDDSEGPSLAKRVRPLSTTKSNENDSEPCEETLENGFYQPHVTPLPAHDASRDSSNDTSRDSAVDTWENDDFLWCLLNRAWLQKRVEAKARDAIPHFPNSEQCKCAYSHFR